MKKSILKSTCVAVAIISSMAVITGCNKKLEVTFDVNASDYVKVGQYKAIEASVDVDAIEKEFLDAKVQNDLDSVTPYVVVDRAAQEEDQVTVAFTGTIGGVTIDGFSSNEYSLVLGTDKFTVEGFVEKLYGLKAGETKIVTLIVPEGIKDAEDYAGKKIVYDITMTTVEAPVVPQITDSYVQENFSYNTVAEYKAGLLANMQESIDEEVNTAKSEAVLKILQDNTEVLEYPQDILNSKLETLNKSISFYSTMNEMTVEEYCISRYGVTLEEYAKKSIVQDLILQEIISKEKLTIDEYYYKGNLESFATSRGYTEPDTFVEKFGKELIVRNMLIQKAVDLVIENAIYN